MKLKWPHFHSDPNYQLKGIWYYYQCQCGARRVRKASINMHGPVDHSWPYPSDSHGNPLTDSDWKMPYDD